MADVDAAPVTDDTAGDAPDGPHQGGVAGATIGRIVAVVVIIGMVVYWIAIFAGVFDKQNPDYLNNRTYANSLQTQCKGLLTDLATLPNAADITSPSQRADVLDQANVMVGQFIRDVQAKAPTTGDEAITMKGWIADWKTYLKDRQDYAKRLHVDPKAQLLLDPTNIGKDQGTGKQPPAAVDESILTFAQVNGILECATPGDVG